MNLTEEEKQFLIGCISGKENYLEYGAGESTKIAREHCTNVVSIETDPNWARTLDVVHVDMGQTGNWGYPVNSPTIEMLKSYYFFATYSQYDILFIDGRFRAGVAYHAKSGAQFLIHDYDRAEYQIIETFAWKLKQRGTLALFERKSFPIIPILNAR